MAAPEADDAAVLAALTLVEAEWAAGLPEGLDTRLGPGGVVLEAAQAQQLTLARVQLADPHTLILDEATSLLDPGTARQAERAMAAVRADRTVIAIAHRLQTAHDADRVAVMEAGRVVELGTHEELVAVAASTRRSGGPGTARTETGVRHRPPDRFQPWSRRLVHEVWTACDARAVMPTAVPSNVVQTRCPDRNGEPPPPPKRFRSPRKEDPCAPPASDVTDVTWHCS
ncbi:hypothetical protein ACFQVA_35685 [Actinomadura keratinilytica]